jgi:hypothetical protein
MHSTSRCGKGQVREEPTCYKCDTALSASEATRGRLWGPFGWASMIAVGREPRRQMLCLSFSMRAHINGEDFIRREPGFSTNQFGLA